MATTRKRRLPPDPDQMNGKRSAWANTAVQAFMTETGTDIGDAVCDLLANLMHWCDRGGFSFEDELTRAKNHYQAETTGDGPLGDKTQEANHGQL